MYNKIISTKLILIQKKSLTYISASALNGFLKTATANRIIPKYFFFFFLKTNARRTLREVNSSVYSSTRDGPIFLSGPPRGTRVSPNYNNEIAACARPPVKNERMDGPSWTRTWTLHDAPPLQGVIQYPSENEKGREAVGRRLAISARKEKARATGPRCER